MPAYPYNPNNPEPFNPNSMPNPNESFNTDSTKDAQLARRPLSEIPIARLNHAFTWARQFDVPPELTPRVEARLREREIEILHARDSYDMCRIIREVIDKVQSEVMQEEGEERIKELLTEKKPPKKPPNPLARTVED